MTTLEAIRTLPTNRTAVPYLKIVHIMSGAVRVESAQGSRRLLPGMAYALGSGRWCRLVPSSQVRTWTVYANERFMRSQMAWFLPARNRVRAGLHPDDWDGNPLVFTFAMPTVRRLEPVWRQLSVMRDAASPPEARAARTTELLAKWTHEVLPAFLAPERSGRPLPPPPFPVSGRLTDPALVGQIGLATRLLREQMHETWTIERMARELSLSRTHLTRLFTRHTGVPPMRYLTETRLTEFTRLVEETDFAIERAARTVGWSDPRVASAWFCRRYSCTPSQFRLNPQPHRSNEDPVPGGRPMDGDSLTGP
ncbi:AraC-type DNA-binding protein [Microbacterium azadirachtae]|uniref:AraC-type DNA-binding protein n=2 Tax=Microbacterium azadirachtae TaxID=582680 RepID=A0A1I6G9U9_9MICO|nr:AraC-type DNA-binding protein [Microbacterium azadirachtae]SEF69462.1 AraC-type DNA-binding protein [Microbacterium azadirachtae]SEF70186.1 AraC-type DNA-binding protein [Microbacterium azadirachtae]SFR38911.1 AraC-type DNA-binding protein [Microbacterium azadirachtae]